MVDWTQALIAVHRNGEKRNVVLKSVKQPDKDGKYTVVGVPGGFSRFTKDGKNGASNCLWHIENAEVKVEQKSNIPRKILSLKDIRQLSDLLPEVSKKSVEPKFKIGDRVRLVDRHKNKGTVVDIEFTTEGNPYYHVRFDYKEDEIFKLLEYRLVSLENPNHSSVTPIEDEFREIRSKVDTKAQITSCIITNLDKKKGGGAFGVRQDNAENVYFPVGISEALDLKEFEIVKAVVVVNDRSSCKWKAIRVTR